MVIAAHIPATAGHNILLQSLHLLAAQHPEISFLWIANEGVLPGPLPSNVHTVAIKPAINSSLRLQYLYLIKLSALLKKYKASLFISPLCMRTAPKECLQWLWIDETAFLQKHSHHRSAFKTYKRRQYKKMLQAANAVLPTAAFMMGQMENHYGFKHPHPIAIGTAIGPQYQCIDSGDKAPLLAGISNDSEYFYFECDAASAHRAIMVLKAFSLFKKRMKSGMKLLLFLDGVGLSDTVKDFHLYKYRHDVIVADAQSTYSRPMLMAAAHAVIWLPPAMDGLCDTGMAALQSGVALMITNDADSRLHYGDAALYTPCTAEAIGQNMMLLYKDETLHRRLITRGLQWAADNSMDAFTRRLWQTILGALPKKEE